MGTFFIINCLIVTVLGHYIFPLDYLQFGPVLKQWRRKESIKREYDIANVIVGLHECFSFAIGEEMEAIMVGN